MHNNHATPMTLDALSRAFRPTIVPALDTHILERSTHDAIAAVIGTRLSENGELFANFLLAKERESEAITARREIEAQVKLRVGVKADGGTINMESDGFKATTVQSIDNKIEDTGAQALEQMLPEALFKRLIRFKPSVDARELKYIRDNEPDIYRVVAEHVTVKPGSVAVKVEVVQVSV